jgi:hypothetical protein
MPAVERTSLALRIYGDTLEPDIISDLTGLAPSQTARRGDIRPSGFVERRGRWVYRVTARTPGDLDGQIRELVQLLPQDPAFWENLRSAFECDLFASVVLRTSNDGFSLLPETLALVSDRHLRLGLDIFDSHSAGVRVADSEDVIHN